MAAAKAVCGLKLRWLVGDIQGCARELKLLLARIRFDPARDEIWSLGDLVNRGPDSLSVLRLWRDVGGRSILGNHDVYALLAFSDPTCRHRDTLDALFAAGDAAALLADLRERPLLVKLPADGAAVGDVWIVHAGLRPGWDDLDATAARINGGEHDDAWLRSDDVAFATRARCCTSDGTMHRHSGTPENCPEPYRPWDSFYRGPLLVVHGHWARRGHYRGERTMGLDSGCVYGGALTAWCHDEDRIVQVPARSTGA